VLRRRGFCAAMASGGYINKHFANGSYYAGKANSSRQEALQHAPREDFPALGARTAGGVDKVNRWTRPNNNKIPQGGAGSGGTGRGWVQPHETGEDWMAARMGTQSTPSRSSTAGVPVAGVPPEAADQPRESQDVTTEPGVQEGGASSSSCPAVAPTPPPPGQGCSATRTWRSQSAAAASAEAVVRGTCGPGGGAGGGYAGGGGGGGRGKGKSPNWLESQPRDVRVSKTLTQVLRHKAVDLGLHIRSDGFCALDDVLRLRWMQELDCSIRDVEKVVQASDKKRFELKVEDGLLLIRAVQGHSMKVIDDKELLTELTINDPDLPPVCVHGTYRKHHESILLNGLLAGGGQGQVFRNHVHFAPLDPWDKRVISGMRYDCEIAIYINLRRALMDGVPFFKSENQVILSPGVDGCVHASYIEKIIDLQTWDVWHNPINQGQ